jgi:hypothetical protein
MMEIELDQVPVDMCVKPIKSVSVQIKQLFKRRGMYTVY